MRNNKVFQVFDILCLVIYFFYILEFAYHILLDLWSSEKTDQDMKLAYVFMYFAHMGNWIVLIAQLIIRDYLYIKNLDFFTRKYHKIKCFIVLTLLSLYFTFNLTIMVLSCKDQNWIKENKIFQISIFSNKQVEQSSIIYYGFASIFDIFSIILFILVLIERFKKTYRNVIDAGLLQISPENLENLQNLGEDYEQMNMRSFQSSQCRESLLQRNEACPICFEEYLDSDKIITFDCSHIFHARCSRKWLQKNITCPICRAVTIIDNKNLGNQNSNNQNQIEGNSG